MKKAGLLLIATAALYGCGGGGEEPLSEQGLRGQEAVAAASKRLGCQPTDANATPGRPDLPLLGKCAHRVIGEDLERRIDDEEPNFPNIGLGQLAQCTGPVGNFSGTEEDIALCLIEQGL